MEELTAFNLPALDEPQSRQEYIERAEMLMIKAAFAERVGQPNDVMLSEAARFIREAQKRSV